MDEAKTLVHMAVSAMITAGFLALAIGIISVGYVIWNYFARQEESSKEMKSYVSYTAYDNTTVRGQEVIQLIQEDDDIFVAIFDGSGSVADDLTLTDRCAIWAHKGGYAETLRPSEIVSTTNNTPTCQRALSAMRHITNLETASAVGLTVSKLTGVDYGYLQSYILYEWGYSDDASTTGGDYAAFKSCLVYDEHSSDVVGVLFVRIPKGVIT